MSLRRRTVGRVKTDTQLKLHKPTMAIGCSLRMCARHVDSTTPGRSNLVFRSKPIAEAEMSNRLINDKEGGAPHKCWNLGPQLPRHATVWEPAYSQAYE